MAQAGWLVDGVSASGPLCPCPVGFLGHHLCVGAFATPLPERVANDGLLKLDDCRALVIEELTAIRFGQ